MIHDFFSLFFLVLSLPLFGLIFTCFLSLAFPCSCALPLLPNQATPINGLFRNWAHLFCFVVFRFFALLPSDTLFYLRMVFVKSILLCSAFTM